MRDCRSLRACRTTVLPRLWPALAQRYSGLSRHYARPSNGVKQNWPLAPVLIDYIAIYLIVFCQSRPLGKGRAPRELKRQMGAACPKKLRFLLQSNGTVFNVNVHCYVCVVDRVLKEVPNIVDIKNAAAFAGVISNPATTLMRMTWQKQKPPCAGASFVH